MLVASKWEQTWLLDVMKLFNKILPDKFSSKEQIEDRSIVSGSLFLPVVDKIHMEYFEDLPLKMILLKSV